MALHRLSEICNLKDPLKKFQIKFTISMNPGLRLAILQQGAASLLSGNSKTVEADKLELRCTSFDYPGTKIGQSDLVIAGFRRKLATIQNKSGTWSCKITEDQDGAVLNTIQSWIDLMHNPFNGLRMPSAAYVSTCVVQIQKANDVGNDSAYSKDGRTIWLKGFYPIEYSVGTIDPSSSDPVEIDVKFNYDWWSETPASWSAIGV